MSHQLEADMNRHLFACRMAAPGSLRVLSGRFLVLSICGCAWLGCAQKPTLTSLDPPSGPPGTVVEVVGDKLVLASVRWDANSSTETQLPSNFLAARFFTVPLAASTGTHPVRLYGDGQYSDNTVNFNVTSGLVRPQPRLDDVTVSLFSIDANGKASMILMAHGANIDVGSKIHINGTAQNSFFSRLLRNPSPEATTPSTLGYPILHYATTWCILQNQTPGTNVDVAVENLDGVLSNTLSYHIAATMDELDSDGDGLPDVWEKNGYDADGDGVVDVDLPALGADPLHKDLFVEVDWMSSAAPNSTIWADIESTFANAPVLNSDGSQGIVIHIDRGAGSGGGGGSTIPYADRIRYDDLTPSPGFTYTNFHKMKTSHFDSKRLNIYRYCIFAWDNGHGPGSSGQAEDILANDFFVSLGSWGTDGQRDDFQVGTFIHELGHTLNLRHGGFEDTNSKDNYNSVMQYGNTWTTVGGQNNKFSPSQFSGIDVDCDMLNVDGVFTYSQGQRRDLDENALNENVGMCDNVARDWNGNGTMQASVSFNLDTNSSLTVIKDFADWANIELNFRAAGSGWGGN
jgi:hypothetical protein